MSLGYFAASESKEVIKKQRDGEKKKQKDGDLWKGHQANLEEFPKAKAGSMWKTK